jgi:hypothetical protein
MGDTIKNLLHNILEGKYTSNSTQMAAAERNYDLENFQMMKYAYDTCMNEEAIKAYGVKPVKDLLDEFEKVFPVEGKPVYGGSNEELTNTIIWLAKHSVAGLVSSDTGVSFLFCFNSSFQRLNLVERPMKKTLIRSPYRLVVQNCPSQKHTIPSLKL